MAMIVGLPLLIPLSRRILAGGITSDERVSRIQTRAFRWAYLLLFVGLSIFMPYRGIWMGDVDASWRYLLPIQAGAFATLLTQVTRNTLRGSSRGWLVAALLSLGLLVYVAGLMLFTTYFLDITPASSAGIFMFGILMSAMAVGYIIMCLLGARRRRREEQAERQDVEPQGAGHHGR
jgi:hypothetical protein